MKTLIQANKQDKIKKLLDTTTLTNNPTQIKNACKKLKLNVFISSNRNECFISMDPLNKCTSYAEL